MEILWLWCNHNNVMQLLQWFSTWGRLTLFEGSRKLLIKIFTILDFIFWIWKHFRYWTKIVASYRCRYSLSLLLVHFLNWCRFTKVGFILNSLTVKYFFKVINFVGCSFFKQLPSENNGHWTVTTQELFVSERMHI